VSYSLRNLGLRCSGMWSCLTSQKSEDLNFILVVPFPFWFSTSSTSPLSFLFFFFTKLLNFFQTHRRNCSPQLPRLHYPKHRQIAQNFCTYCVLFSWTASFETCYLCSLFNTKQNIGRTNAHITERNTTILKCFVTNPVINFPEEMQITTHYCVRTCPSIWHVSWVSVHFVVHSNHISLTKIFLLFMAKLLVCCCFLIRNFYASSSPPFTFGLHICPLFKCQHFLFTSPAFGLTAFCLLTSPVSLFSA
jgi:hypothetical protein